MSTIRVNPFNIQDYYFPVNLSQFENLVGKMLTHVEAMNLPDVAEKANKDLVRQSLWKWWDEAQENSLTSWKGCIGPILATPHTPDSDKVGVYHWITDIGRVVPIEEGGYKENQQSVKNVLK